MKVFFLIISIVTFVILFFVQGELFYTSLGLSFSIYLGLDFIDKLGKIFPLKEFILFIAAAQWLVGAKLSYYFGALHHKYHMYVDEYTYMSYVVPGIILFAMGIRLINIDLDLSSLVKHFESDKEQLKIIGFLLSVSGLFFGSINRFLNIPEISFILYLGNIILYVGIAHLFYVYPNRKLFIYFSVIGTVFVLSLTTGMFHNLLLITSLLSFFIFSKKTSFILKVLIFIIGGAFLYSLQNIKSDFREFVWNDKVGNPIPVFVDLFVDQFTKKDINVNYVQFNDPNEKSASINNRINQGWIISKIIYNVPSNQPYQNGETIIEGIKSSFIPRFLNPDKKGGGYSLEKFKEITDVELSSKTAMGLSLIGEVYANFGYIGGILSMFIYGIFISWVMRFIKINLANDNPLIIIWFIWFFYQVVKAETELMTVINHLVKSILFFLFFRRVLIIYNINLLPINWKL